MVPLAVTFALVMSAFIAVCFVLVLLRIEVFRLSNADALAAVVAQLGKAKEEVLGRISSLEAAAAAGEDLSGPLAELAAAAQALDDVVPDAVEDVVVDVPVEVVEEAPVEDAPPVAEA